MPFPAPTIATACRMFGTQLHPLPSGVDGPQLMWALAGVESSFGKNTTPRHEPGYDVGGHYATRGNMPALLARFGSAAAYSYGPWQIMFTNTPAGYTPEDFQTITGAALAARYFLNGMLARLRPQSLVEIGECFNAGHITPDPEYTDKLVRCYAIPMNP